MSILLNFLIVYIFFSFIIIGFFFSKVKINIKKLEIKFKDKKTDKKYAINIGLYLYGLIKICGINIENDGIRFGFKKILYSKIKNSKIYTNLKKIDLKSVEREFKLKELKNLKFELENLNLNLELGCESVLLTSFMIFIISTLLSIAIKDSTNKYNPLKYKYVIKPHYRSTNMMNLNANCIIAIKTEHIIFILLNYRKRREKVYERTSYRRSYENSYE